MLSTDHHTLKPAKWVDNHADFLYRYAASRISDRETSRDLVQDVFLAALEKVPSFEGRSTERTWLTSILRYKIIDIYRKKAAGSVEMAIVERFEASADGFFEANGHWTEKHRPVPVWDQHSDVIQSKEFEKILGQCMKKLPLVCKSVFTMKHLDGDSATTICQSLNLTQSNYWTIIHRAKLNLRACLQKNWI